MVARVPSEAEKTAQVPGIIFATEGEERVPRIAGTGLEIAEVIAVYLAAGRDKTKLRCAFPWLADQQLHAALQYYETYPSDIDSALAENDDNMA